MPSSLRSGSTRQRRSRSLFSVESCVRLTPAGSRARRWLDESGTTGDLTCRSLRAGRAADSPESAVPPTHSGPPRPLVLRTLPGWIDTAKAQSVLATNVVNLLPSRRPSVDAVGCARLVGTDCLEAPLVDVSTPRLRRTVHQIAHREGKSTFGGLSAMLGTLPSPTRPIDMMMLGNLFAAPVLLPAPRSPVSSPRPRCPLCACACPRQRSAD